MAKSKNEAKIRFTAETEQFNKQIKAANGELSALRAELGLNATEMKGMSDATEKLQERKALLEKELETAASKTEALRGKMEAAKRIYGENSDEVLNLKKQITLATTAEVKIRQEIERVNGALAAQATETTDARTELEKLEDTISEQESALAELKNEYANALLKYGAHSGIAEELARKVGKLSAELLDNKKKLSDTRKATDNLVNGYEETADKADETKTAFSALEKRITDQTAELDGLKQAYKEAVVEFGETSDEATQLANKLKTLSGELNDSRNRMSKAEAAADKLADTTQDAGEAAEDSADGWSIVKDVIADLASQAVQAAAEAFEDLLFNGEAALDMLMVKTDMSSGAMDELGDAAYDVFNRGWGESLSDVTESMSTVYSMMGDMDFEYLSEYTENAMTLSDVWGYDVAESIRAVNSLEKQFGINGEEAFNLIAQGAQYGLDQNGDLLDTINEYSVQFAKAGYSADDMFNMLLNGVTAGTWSVDKLGDAFKEFGIRVSDGTVADALMENRKTLGMTKSDVKKLTAAYGKGGEEGKAAMEKTLDAVLSVKDENERYMLGVELFGTMWEDLGEDAIKALLDTEGGITATDDAMSRIKTDAYDNLSTSVATLGRTLKNDLLIPIVDAITPALKSIVNWAIEHMDILKPIIVGVAAAFSVLAGALAISGIISGVQKAFAILNTTLLANPITLIIAAIAGLVAAFVYLWNNCEGFRQFWIDLWHTITNALSVAGEWIANFFTQTIPAAWNSFMTWLSGVGASIAAWWSEMWASISAWWSETWTSFTTWLSELGASIAAWWSETYNSVTTWVSNIYNSVVTWFSNIWASITSTVSNIYTSVSTWFSNIWSTITTTCSNIWSGIVSVWDSIKTSVTTAVENVRDKVATVFETVRTKVTAVWEGIKSAIQNPIETAKKLVSNAVSGIRTTITSVFDAVKSKATSIWNGIKSAIQTPIEKARDLVKSAIDKIKGFFDFSFTWPKLKMPHFSFTGSWNPFDWPDKFPKIGVEWYAKGGILNGPTLFGINSSGQAMVGGEAGPEAVAPIDVLLGYVTKAVRGVFSELEVPTLGGADNRTFADRLETSNSFRQLERMVDAIESVADRPIEIYLDSHRIAVATASASDNVSGNRLNLRTRGLALE